VLGDVTVVVVVGDKYFTLLELVSEGCKLDYFRHGQQTHV
jgi:hypothetical protein